MKKTKRLIVLLMMIVTIACLAFSFAACGQSDDPPEDDGIVLTFTASIKNAINAKIAIGDYAYALKLDLYDGGTLKLQATAIGDKSEATVVGGGSNAGVDLDDMTNHQGNSEFAAYNFEYDGTWLEEDGWGYTVNINDAAKSEIKVDYDKLKGRHNFHYYVSPVINGVQVAKTVIEFIADDSSYRKELASDYETYHEKESTYYFYAYSSDGSRYNKNQMYLMPDGSVANYSEEGSEYSYDGLGTWSETENHVITINSASTTYVSDKYDSTLGYRFSKASNNESGFISINDDYLPSTMTDEMFDGEKTDTINGTGAVIKQNGSDVAAPAYASYTLELYEKGSAKIFDETGTLVAAGSYTGSSDYSVTIGDGSGTFADGNLNIDVTITTTTKRGPNITTTVRVYDFTFTDN